MTGVDVMGLLNRKLLGEEYGENDEVDKFSSKAT